MKQQAVLGDFVFSSGDGTAYEQLQRKSGGGWVSIDVVNGKPRSQNTGQPLLSLQLSGKWFGFAGDQALARLRAMQSDRKPFLFTDGYGNNWGRFKLVDLTENHQRVIDDGTSMVIPWSLSLEEFVGEGS